MKSLLKITALLVAAILISGSGYYLSLKAQPQPSPALVTAPKVETAEIKWISISEAERLNKKKKKKIFIDIYTEWCGWCKRLDASTYRDPRVVKYINENFYAVKLDAESKETITYKGTQYNFDPNARMNMVSAQFLGKQPGYPTLTYLDESLKVLRIAPGYVDANNMLSQLKYINENYYLNMTFEKFKAEVDGKEG